MKNTIYTAFSVLLLFCGMAHADESDLSNSELTFIECERIYIQPEQVAITPEGIYFQFKESWIPTDAIHHDSDGIFISSISDDWSVLWVCPECRSKNKDFESPCLSCGFDP